MKIFCSILIVFFSTSSFADWSNMNTGINDDFTGVVFWGSNGIVSGSTGLYYTTNGGLGDTSWTRYNITTNTADSLIYNHTKFNHCYANSYTGNNVVYACGEDTIAKKAIIIRIAFPQP